MVPVNGNSFLVFFSFFITLLPNSGERGSIYVTQRCLSFIPAQSDESLRRVSTRAHSTEVVHPAFCGWEISGTTLFESGAPLWAITIWDSVEAGPAPLRRQRKCDAGLGRGNKSEADLRKRPRV